MPPSQMIECYDRMSRRLRQLCDGPVYYLPNPGNWGDALIRYGTLKFLRDIGVKVTEKKLRKRYWIIPRLRGGTVLYGGGGGWSKHWNLGGTIEPLTQRFQVVVLPSTYDCNHTMGRTVFFCRDKAESFDCMPGSEFCHDMAFYIGDEFENGSKGDGSGWFFRSDLEGAGWKGIPLLNRDLSLEGHHASDVRPFFQAVARYEVIHTDRLHVAIAGCLLGREVHLYANNYFKNRAVYESSMRGFFDRVFFHDFDDREPSLLHEAEPILKTN